MHTVYATVSNSHVCGLAKDEILKLGMKTLFKDVLVYGIYIIVQVSREV